jgi:hypothetical protein
MHIYIFFLDFGVEAALEKIDEVDEDDDEGDDDA